MVDIYQRIDNFYGNHCHLHANRQDVGCVLDREMQLISKEIVPETVETVWQFTMTESIPVDNKRNILFITVAAVAWSNYFFYKNASIRGPLPTKRCINNRFTRFKIENEK